MGKEASKVSSTGPKQRVHLFGFMDETGLLITPLSEKIFGLGLLVLHQTKYTHDEIIKLRQRTGYSSEFKFSHVRRNNLALYKLLVDIFFNTPNARFCSIIIDKQKTPIKSPKHTKAYNAFAGELISKAIKISKNSGSEYITILADDVSTSIDDKYEKEIRAKVKRTLRRNALFGVCRIESHALSEIQLCDVLLGAVAYSFKLREGLVSAPLQAKIDLIKYIQQKLGSNQLSISMNNKGPRGVCFYITEKSN